MGMHCPYCGNDDVDWMKAQDALKWLEEDGGVMYTSGLRCRDPACKGAKGFTIEVGFSIGSEVTYLDEDGDEIEEVEE